MIFKNTKKFQDLKNIPESWLISFFILIKKIL